jgi:hypothetical protein
MRKAAAVPLLFSLLALVLMAPVSPLSAQASAVTCTIPGPHHGSGKPASLERGTIAATDSPQFTAPAFLFELIRGRVVKPIYDFNWDVDTSSVVHVALRGDAKPQVKVAVTLLKGSNTSSFNPPDWGWTKCGPIWLGPAIDMNDKALQDQDGLTITLTTTQPCQCDGKPDTTVESTQTFTLTRKDLGWHRSISDTVAFVQRLGVSKEDVQNGIAKVNFTATPGVTLGTNYTPRRDETFSLLRFLSPGFGVTASFLDWQDQAMLNTSDPMHPTFTGAKSSNINLGVGGQMSLFDGMLSALYGVNLQGTAPRRYWGIGLSFVNVYQKIQSLTATPSSAKPQSSNGAAGSPPAPAQPAGGTTP